MDSDPRKSVPDRILSAMITRTLYVAENEGLELTSRDIYEYISSNTFYYEHPEQDKYGRPIFSGDYTHDNLPALRKALDYCRHAGYISKHGSSRPYTFQLTTEGRLYSQDPWYKYNLKMAYIHKLIDEIVSRTLSNDDAVNEIAERKRIELCKTCRLSNPKSKRLPARSWTVRPHQGKIGIQRKDGTVMDVEVTEDGEIKELEDLKASLVMKDGKVDAESTIMSLQNEKEYLTGVLREAGIRYQKLDTQLEKERGRKGKADMKRNLRGLSHMEIAHYYLENGMIIDADFMQMWGGSLVVVEYKRTVGMEILHLYYDIQSTKSEIMKRTDLARRILEPHEIPSIGIYIEEIRAGSIVVNSEHFKEPKSLVM